MGFCCALLLICLSFGCSTTQSHCAPTVVACELQRRTSHSLIENPCSGQPVIPPDVQLEDGLSEEEAIATALANNAAFRATLAQLEMTRGDVIQAGLLANPNLVALFPVSAKQLEWTLYLPVDAFLLRPKRRELAECDYQRVAYQIVQSGLDLVRDVRVAHADWELAVEQSRLGQEAVEIRERIAELTGKRLNRGEISELESITAQIDALNARAAAALLQQTVSIAQSRLARLMGLPFAQEQLVVGSGEPYLTADLDLSALTQAALESRPDMQSAHWAVATAERRAELSRWLFLRFDGIADANQKGDKGSEAGPGIRVDLPVFNRNQGGVVRANAEWTAAVENRTATRDQIVQDVQVAVAQVRQAQDNLAILEDQVVPSVREALLLAGKAYEDGAAPFLLVLQTASQYLDARSRTLDQVAALRRAWAELERGVGQDLRRKWNSCRRPSQSISMS